MLFTQAIFLIFFSVVFILHWTLRKNSLRKILLLAASYVFYAGWDYRFLALIFLSTLIDYIVALRIIKTDIQRSRKILLTISMCSNLGILAFFKYFNFFVQSSTDFLELLGIEATPATLEIILPVGISFFTFQSMSYTIDVYRKNMEPVHNFFDFALYVSFFPQLVAGPIVRARDFLPQLRTARELSKVQFKAPLLLFLIGFFKKACVANNLAPYVDRVFAEPEAYSAMAQWLATFAYTIQIYADFSGYTDMAIAIAALLGYHLPINFNFPYFSANIQEFWRRWHISLSFWLRDYLYISLGGNRGTKLFHYRNMMLTMLLGGLWHGAAWTFVIWGGLHGLALCLHRVYREWVEHHPKVARPFAILGVPLTLTFAALMWVFFRATSLEGAMSMVQSLLFLKPGGDAQLPVELAFGMAALLAAHFVAYKVPLQEKIKHVPDFACAILFGLIMSACLILMPLEYQPFIYFQF